MTPDSPPQASQTRPRSSRFQFKTRSRGDVRRSASPATEQAHGDGDDSPATRGHHRHDREEGQERRHHHRHRRKKHRRSSSSPTSVPRGSPPPSPNTAFRESLFDALADEEGAAYWESVYGQPVHTYSRYRESSQTEAAGPGANDGAGPSLNGDGPPVLERMSDDEYAAYVRARMWEKSHDYIAEERARREQQRQRDRDRDRAYTATQRMRADEDRWRAMMGDTATASARDASSMTKKATAEQLAKRQRWMEYLQQWVELGRLSDSSPDSVPVPRLAWPNLRGSARQLSATSITEFFRIGAEVELAAQKFNGEGHGATSEASSKARQTVDADAETRHGALLAVVKRERVRWHPDKMARQLAPWWPVGQDATRDTTPGNINGNGNGGGDRSRGRQRPKSEDKESAEPTRLDRTTVQNVTAVFQMIDRIWTELKAGNNKG